MVYANANEFSIQIFNKSLDDLEKNVMYAVMQLDFTNYGESYEKMTALFGEKEVEFAKKEAYKRGAYSVIPYMIGIIFNRLKQGLSFFINAVKKIVNEAVDFKSENKVEKDYSPALTPGGASQRRTARRKKPGGSKTYETLKEEFDKEYENFLQSSGIKIDRDLYQLLKAVKAEFVNGEIKVNIVKAMRLKNTWKQILDAIEKEEIKIERTF